MQWQAVVSSAIGIKHIQMGKPCQDWGAYQILSEGHVLIGAVSDGMGSAKHSEIGSQLAVEVVISQLQQDYWQSQLTDEGAVKQFFAQLLTLVKSKLQQQADTQGYPVQDLACTLLAFIATPQWLAAMQIGDGCIVVRAEGGDYQLLFQPDKGEFANETTPITASDALQEMQVCLKSIAYKFICVTTDGIENISLIKPENWKPFAKFFRPLEQHMLSRLSLEQKKKKLDDFLHSETIAQSTDDDTTLLLGVYPDSVLPEASKAEGRAQFGEALAAGSAEDIYPELKNRIIDELDCLGEQKFKLKTFKLNKGCLEILLESDESLSNPELCFLKISEVIDNFKKLSIQKVKILNVRQKHWSVEQDIKTFTKKRIINIIAKILIFICILIINTLYFHPSLSIFGKLKEWVNFFPGLSEKIVFLFCVLLIGLYIYILGLKV